MSIFWKKTFRDLGHLIVCEESSGLQPYGLAGRQKARFTQIVVCERTPRRITPKKGRCGPIVSENTVDCSEVFVDMLLPLSTAKNRPSVPLFFNLMINLSPSCVSSFLRVSAGASVPPEHALKSYLRVTSSSRGANLGLVSRLVEVRLWNEYERLN